VKPAGTKGWFLARSCIYFFVKKLFFLWTRISSFCSQKMSVKLIKSAQYLKKAQSQNPDPAGEMPQEDSRRFPIYYVANGQLQHGPVCTVEDLTQQVNNYVEMLTSGDIQPTDSKESPSL
jgi:hypothetical protein